MKERNSRDGCYIIHIQLEKEEKSETIQYMWQERGSRGIVVFQEHISSTIQKIWF